MKWFINEFNFFTRAEKFDRFCDRLNFYHPYIHLFESVICDTKHVIYTSYDHEQKTKFSNLTLSITAFVKSELIRVSAE